MIVQDTVSSELAIFFPMLCKSFGTRQPSRSGYLFCRRFADTLALIDQPHRVLTNLGFLRHGSTLTTRQQLEKRRSCRKCAVLTHALLFKVVVERHQVRRLDVTDFQVPQPGGDSGAHLLIIVQGLGFQLLLGVLCKPTVNQVIQQHFGVKHQPVARLFLKLVGLLLYPAFRLPHRQPGGRGHGSALCDDLSSLCPPAVRSNQVGRCAIFFRFLGNLRHNDYTFL